MAPTLRSSAQNTPTRDASEPLTPTRKTHTCSKCKRPKAGHPRSGCPFVDDTPTKNHASQTPSPLKRGNIEDAMGSMFLASSPSEREDETKALIRERRRSSRITDLAVAGSLPSLDGESQEIIERLTQPGMFDDDSTRFSPTQKTPKVVRWQETLQFFPSDPNDKIRRIKMPGSLFSPSPESSLASVIEGDKILSSDLAHSQPAFSDNGNSTQATALDPVSPSAMAPRTLQPSGDSMTIQQRSLFLTSLNNSSDATVYVVPRDDVYNLQAEAIKLGFHARVVLAKDPNDHQGLLILARNEPAVRSLHERVELERRKTSSFRAAASGAVVGAVGTFAGLAFT